MYSVMLVDDFEFYRNEIRAVGGWGDVSGFSVVSEAEDGLAALEKLRKDPVDLLITDIRMPLLDGIELTKKVMEDELCGCVVLMSQFSDFEYARKGISSGAFEYMLKPVEIEELLKVLLRAARHIERKKTQMLRSDVVTNILSRSSQMFYSETELRKLAIQLGETNTDALLTAGNLIESTYVKTGFNMINTAYILNNAVGKLTELINHELPWLSKFMDLADLVKADYSTCADFSEMRTEFVGLAAKLLRVVGSFDLGDVKSGMIRKACRIILTDVDSEITLGRLSELLFISRTYLSSLFKDMTGVNIVKYIAFAKTERAKFLLTHTNLKTYEIGDILCFSDKEYFSKLLKRIRE